MLVAQITDTHVLAAGKLYHAPRRAFPPDAPADWSHIDTAACLSRAIAELNARTPQPDIVVMTGDLVDHGGPEAKGCLVDERHRRCREVRPDSAAICCSPPDKLPAGWERCFFSAGNASTVRSPRSTRIVARST